MLSLIKASKNRFKKEFIPKNELEREVIKTMIKNKFKIVYEMYKNNTEKMNIFLLKLFEISNITIDDLNTNENGNLFDFRFYENDSNYLNFLEQSEINSHILRLYNLNQDNFLNIIYKNIKIKQIAIEYIKNLLNIDTKIMGDKLFDVYLSVKIDNVDMWKNLNDNLIEFDDKDELKQWLQKVDTFLLQKYSELNDNPNLEKNLINLFKREYFENTKILLAFLLFNETKFLLFFLLNTQNINILHYCFSKLDSSFTQLFFQYLDNNYQYEIIKRVLNLIKSKTIFSNENLLDFLTEVSQRDLNDEIKSIIFVYMTIYFYNSNQKIENIHKAIDGILNIVLDIKNKKFVSQYRDLLKEHDEIYELIDNKIIEILKKPDKLKLDLIKRGVFFELITDKTMEKIINNVEINKNIDDIASISNQLLIYKQKSNSKHLNKLAITMGLSDVSLLEYKEIDK